MCGIAGFVGGTNAQGLAAVQAMTEALRRRGPDSEGIECWPGAVLGHRRLAIIDLSPLGHQPMVSDDRKVGLVFNGCIYNFLDLRAELEQLGWTFRSRCDTEVLLHGYRQWGIDELAKRLRGMFAFAIWDAETRSLCMVRDRLGVKPLVYAEVDGGVAFASTVRALEAAGLARDIDPQAVLEFLEFGFVTEKRCIFSGMRKVAPATIVEWKSGRFNERKYWQLPDAEPHGIGFEEAVEETERLLVESVRLRLQADVPVGALLSAGIDSTLVCWALAKLNTNVHAFTVSTPGDPVDEAPAAAETARRLGIPHEIVSIENKESEVLEELIDAYGEPFGCSSALAMLRVSHAVRPKAKVLLTGDGGDDVFLGYRFHRQFWIAQRLGNWLPPGSLALWKAVRPLADAVPALKRAKHLVDYATGGLGAVTKVHDGLPYYRSKHLLGDRLADGEIEARRIPWTQKSARRVLQDVLHYDLTTQFAGEFMTKVDGGTMYHGLEARSPFLDQRMWEFAARLPFKTRLKGGVLKAVLREIVRKNVGPDVAFRKKQGFSIPVEQWLVTRWAETLKRFADESELCNRGWLRRDSMGDAIDQSLAGGSAPVQLWNLIVLDHWFRRAGVSREAPAALL
jgi:asparagine synthase (glutamine-hydrolysing)